MTGSARKPKKSRTADRKDSKRFYDSLRAFYDPQPSTSSLLLSSDGTTLSADRTKILERWAEHFNVVLNRPPFINDEGTQHTPHFSVNQEMAMPPLSRRP